MKRMNMAAWSDALRKNGFEKLAKDFETNKEEDIRRLRTLGIPVLDIIHIDYVDFHENNEDVLNFIKKHGDVVIMTIPRKKDLLKAYKIGIYSFEDCKKFLDENIVSDHELYCISLTEHQKNIGSGIIISGDNKVVVEIADSYLDDLTYGKSTPVGCVIENGNFNFNTSDTVKQEIMRNALEYIKKDGEFIKGYFEFILVKGNKVIFFDYKENEAYWRKL